MQSIIRRFVIEGEGSIVRTLSLYDGQSFRLTMDGAQVCCGTWADCRRVALLMARDWDTITSGAAAVDVEAWCERFSAAERLIASLKAKAEGVSHD